MWKKKEPREKFKQKLPETLVGDLRTLRESPGWIFVTKKLDEAAKDLKWLLWKPCTDQTLRYNADHLLKERLAVIYIMMTLPVDNIELLEQILHMNEESRMPLIERLEKLDKKYAEELSQYIRD